MAASDISFGQSAESVRNQRRIVCFGPCFSISAATEYRRQRRARIAAGRRVVPATAFVIRNGRLDPDWATVQRRTLSIAGRAIDTMITASGYNDVLRMYYTAQRDGIGFNLAYIGSDFTRKLPEPFDQGFMRALFDYGYQRALRGYDWSKAPPTV
jgi:hypothetical protein